MPQALTTWTMSHFRVIARSEATKQSPTCRGGRLLRSARNDRGLCQWWRALAIECDIVELLSHRHSERPKGAERLKGVEESPCRGHSCHCRRSPRIRNPWLKLRSALRHFGGFFRFPGAWPFLSPGSRLPASSGNHVPGRSRRQRKAHNPTEPRGESAQARPRPR